MNANLQWHPSLIPKGTRLNALPLETETNSSVMGKPGAEESGVDSLQCFRDSHSAMKRSVMMSASRLKDLVKDDLNWDVQDGFGRMVLTP
jgi:hypothetical protein